MSSYQTTIDKLTRSLLSQQQHNEQHAYWVGRLSSSALSTGLACLALAVCGEEKQTIKSGVDYLINQQCDDGSWGDTDNSPGNISTTLLVWSALRFIDDADAGECIKKAEMWISNEVGSLDASEIVQHIEDRYGKDRTFAVPILMACCIAGCFGSGSSAWRYVRQLPFELAAFPQQLYALLQLPVVSYALPALIAIGIARHKNAGTLVFPLRWMRGLLIKRCMRKLKSIQPENGGFLEATPLTAFVCMALVKAGYQEHSVVHQARAFLLNSQRSDGSWPIDTNLSTWVSSLSIHAFNEEQLSANSEKINQWYSDQQYTEVHPYTGAKPGGWAWTNLPGAVPDADDTSGALLALAKIKQDNLSQAERGLEWLMQLQNKDGGMPTFCRGWGTLPFDKSCADISAHALRAMAAWYPRCRKDLKKRVRRAMERLRNYLQADKGAYGTWLPLWFGNQADPKHENRIFGTARVLLAVKHLEAVPEKSYAYLLTAQNEDGSWGADKGVAGTVEETALAIEALSLYSGEYLKLDIALDRGVEWLCAQWDQTPEPQPIGLYFASLWYYEDLYPLCFSLAALRAYKQRKESS